MAARKIEYDFGGPIGATGIVFGLPVFMNVLYFACNDISGCPAPALLSPRSLTWDSLKAQIPWPEDGLGGFVSWEATAWLLAYYALSLVLYRVLPAQELFGTKLKETGKPLKYRFNAFSATVFQLVPCIVGTYMQGADFFVWTWITDNYLQLLSANIIIANIISVIVYVNSFNVKPGNPDMRELAVGGHTGNVIYDFFIGRELNPRVNIPLIGEVDVKAWLEMRPGLTGWLLLNLSFVAKQYRQYGFVSDSIVFIAAVQGYYVLEGQYAEAGILGMMDITTDGLGFMLTFGDIVWVPFLYSTQVRYLSTYPVHLGWQGLAIVGTIFAVGLYIFRSSNSQKSAFRKDPNDKAFKDMSFIQTKRGTRLLTGGWWGRARHINYFGDWLQSLPFCLPTGFAGYVILPAVSAAFESMEADAATMLDGRRVVPGQAAGWGMLFTYFYSAWFGFLLVHRERRDDAACQEKYGDDWETYKKTPVTPWFWFSKRGHPALLFFQTPSAMASTGVISYDEAKQHAFDSVLHRNSKANTGGLRAMVNKNSAANAAASQDYFQYWDDKKAEDETEKTRKERTSNYANLTRQYYNLATDFYEYGWSQSFHFCRFAYGESFHRAIARHEHYLAHNMGIGSDMKVLDVGCGVGGPAREIVKFTGAHVTGLNINEYQVERAGVYAEREGLSHRLKFVQGDFMKMPFPDNSFDAVYAIEATVHAPSLQGVYSEILRVLKPGGVFGVYEWLMTEDYDNDNLEHRRIRLDIEQGNGIAQMVKISHGVEAMQGAGFTLDQNRDLAATSDLDAAPWYWPLDSSLRHAQTAGDVVTVLRMNRMETVGLFPPGEAFPLPTLDEPPPELPLHDTVVDTTRTELVAELVVENSDEAPQEGSDAPQSESVEVEEIIDVTIEHTTTTTTTSAPIAADAVEEPPSETGDAPHFEPGLSCASIATSSLSVFGPGHEESSRDDLQVFEHDDAEVLDQLMEIVAPDPESSDDDDDEGDIETHAPALETQSRGSEEQAVQPGKRARAAPATAAAGRTRRATMDNKEAKEGAAPTPKRGRPAGRLSSAQKVADTPATGKKRGRPAATPASVKQVNGTPASGKRRGRPPGTPSTAQKTAGTPASGKKRGRPSATPASAKKAQDVPSATPKRGRPAATPASAQAKDTSVSEKRRGRPKAAEAAAPSTVKAVPTAGAGRGRRSARRTATATAPSAKPQGVAKRGRPPRSAAAKTVSFDKETKPGMRATARSTAPKANKVEMTKAPARAAKVTVANAAKPTGVTKRGRPARAAAPSAAAGAKPAARRGRAARAEVVPQKDDKTGSGVRRNARAAAAQKAESAKTTTETKGRRGRAAASTSSVTQETQPADKPKRGRPAKAKVEEAPLASAPTAPKSRKQQTAAPTPAPKAAPATTRGRPARKVAGVAKEKPPGKGAQKKAVGTVTPAAGTKRTRGRPKRA
ncbi:hypothetical protein S40293_09061 [Stachybotrys chartarum IBT 40293]|nr:hypothetical protein S40293_09061 [Stachybotrys chartarum IBT 40293]